METPDPPHDVPENPAPPNGKKQKFVCSECELICRDKLRLEQHASGHLQTEGWECSVCGVRFAKAPFDRNRHEENVHNLLRDESDLTEKEAVRIKKHQLGRLKNVGNRLVVVQRGARSSLSGATDEATADELRAHMLKTLRPRKSELPVAESGGAIAAQGPSQPTERPAQQTGVEDSPDEMLAMSGQKRSRRVVPIQPFVRRELFASDEDEPETSIEPSSPKTRKLSARSLAASFGSRTGKAAARPDGESSALSSSQGGDFEEESTDEEAVDWSVRLRSRKTTSPKSQPTTVKKPTQASLSSSEDDEEEEEQQEEASGDFNSSQPKNSAMRVCTECGISVGVVHFQKHMAGHSREVGWQCALCGIRVATQRKRQKHEERGHGLRRCRFDQEREEAILIEEAQLKTLRSIGTNFHEIQRGAVRSVASFVQLPTLLAATRQATGRAIESRRPEAQRQPSEMVALDKEED